MLEFSCPSCGRQFQTDDSKAGKVVRCKCGTRFQVSAVAPVAALASGDDPPMPDVPIPMPDSFTDGATYTVTSSGDLPEPWFYRYLTFFAYFILIIGLLVLFAALLFSVGYFLYLAASQHSASLALLAAIPTLYTAFGAFVVVAEAALVLLFLDMARSFRSLRRIADQVERIAYSKK
jgi:hypothetical protein